MNNKKLRVLISCEYSGRTREAFAKLGHDAMSCDLLPTEQPGNHYQGDVRDVLGEHWDMIIAHPDCTYITNSGVRWLDTDITRWKKLYEACEFFKLFLNHPCEKIIIENPIPHKYGAEWIGKKYTQTIQPWMFGHTETKRTCLWLKGVPELVETNNVKALMDSIPKKETNKVHYASPGPDRWKERSRTYQGISDAMAMQYGGIVK
jgi:hypothetical protein